MTPEQAKLVKAAQVYDLDHRPAHGYWMGVGDDQVLRLLTGAKLAREDARAIRPCTVADQIGWMFECIRDRYGPARKPE